MNILQQQVSHARFGVGTVTDQTDRLVTVLFETTQEAKTFLYPTAFETFLTLGDPYCQAQMQQELQRRRDAATALRQQQEAEAEAQRLAEKIAAMTQKKRAAAAKRAAARKSAKKP